MKPFRHEGIVGGRGCSVRLAASLMVLIFWLTELHLLGQQRVDNSTPQGNHRTVRAVRTQLPIKLDGNLDDPGWKEVEPAADFVQTEPYEGEPATERTAVKVLYDAQNL